MAAQRSAQHLAELLTAGSGKEGPDAAAVHLLVFTDVHARTELAPFIEDGEDGEHAFVTREGWRSLPALEFSPPLASSTARLLRLAAGLATGEPVDVRDAMRSLGRAHARRVAEAVLMVSGVYRSFDLVEMAEARKPEELIASFSAAPPA